MEERIKARAGRRKAYYRANRESVCKRQNAARYGITADDYDRMWDRQGGRCASCEDRLDERPAIDHDHTDGRVRAILCLNCNTALGLLRDDPVRVYLLFEYIAKHTESE